MLFKYGVLLGALCALTLALEHFEVKFEWDGINYTWPSKEMYQDAVRNKLYEKEYNSLIDIKLWKGNMHVTTNRGLPGVPVSMAVTPASPVNGNKLPLLEPYPNWDMQKIGGDCSGFQSVWKVEIDPMGRMWVPDRGRIYTTTSGKVECSPRLLILDLEKGGKVLMNYTFPPEVARIGYAKFENIVLDHEDGGFAYISDADVGNSGLIIFSLQNCTSWRVEVDQRPQLIGLALSPADSKDSRKLYYISWKGKLLEVPTHKLKNKSLSSKISNMSKDLNVEVFARSVLTMSNTGVMFLTNGSYVSTWDSKSRPFRKLENTERFDDIIYSQTIDEKGNFWFRSYDKVFIIPNDKMKNYQYLEDGTVPELPSIASGASKSQLTLTTATITMLFMIKIFFGA